jgi:hypothetical protein
VSAAPVRRLQSQPSVRLVTNERPLIVLPSLAKVTGLDGAVFLQQLHYWTSQPGAHERDGCRWVYNTLAQWLEQFPFWTKSTLHRVISDLEAKGFIVSTATYNAKGSDRTKWYRINHEHPDLVMLASEHVAAPEPENPRNGAISHFPEMDHAIPGNGKSISQNREMLKEHKTTTETTTENVTPPTPSKGDRASSSKTKSKETTWPEGFALNDALRATARRARIRSDRIEDVFQRFQDRAIAKGLTYASWPHAWSTWVYSEYQDKYREPERAAASEQRRKDPAAAKRAAAVLEEDIRRMEEHGKPDWQIANVRRELDKARRAMEATA